MGIQELYKDVTGLGRASPAAFPWTQACSGPGKRFFFISGHGLTVSAFLFLGTPLSPEWVVWKGGRRLTELLSSFPLDGQIS